MSRQYPEIPGEVNLSRDEGLCFHKVVEKILTDDVVVQGEEFHGVAVSLEMLEHAAEYVEEVRSWDVEAFHVERPIDASVINPECGGTPDVWGYRPGLLRLLDAKYGHRHVEVYGHWQLLIYVAAILAYLGIDGHADQFTQVEIIVYQPRCYDREGHFRRWRIMACDLRGYFNQLRTGAEATFRDDAQCKTGPWCMDCSARHACTTAQRAARQVFDMAGMPVPNDLPTAAIGAELMRIEWAMDMLKARQTGLEAQAMFNIRNGVQVPGWDIERGEGRLYWLDEKKARAMADLMGVNIVKEPELITPTQFIKANKELQPMVAAMTGRPLGAEKLARVDITRLKKLYEENKS